MSETCGKHRRATITSRRAYQVWAAAMLAIVATAVATSTPSAADSSPPAGTPANQQKQPAITQNQQIAIALARYYLVDGDYRRVITTLRPNPKKEPLDTQTSTWCLLGQAYLHTGELSQARQCAAQALAQDPRTAHAYLIQGAVHARLGQHALALVAYEKAAQLGHDEPQLDVLMAESYMALGNYIGPLSMQRVLGGQTGQMYEGFYLVESVDKQPDRFYAAPRQSALYHIQRALQAGLDEPRVHLLHGQIWLAAGKYDQALEVFAQLEPKAKQLPVSEQGRFYHDYAEAYLHRGEPTRFLELFQKAVAVDRQTFEPQLAQAYRSCADYYGAAGDLAHFIHFLKLALEHDPVDVELHYRLANALYEAGRRREAGKHWRITLELAPNHPDRHRMLNLMRTSR